MSNRADTSSAADVNERIMRAYRKLKQAEAKGCQREVAKARKAYFLSGANDERKT